VTAGGNPVAVTGMGVVSAVGSSVPVFFGNLVVGHSGVCQLPWHPDNVAARVDFAAEFHFSRLQLATLDRFAQFALVASEQAVKDAALTDSDLAGPRAGVYFGTGMGGASAIEAGYRGFLAPKGRVSPMTIPLTMANAAASHVAIRYRIQGPSLTYSIACASAAVAIGEAFRAIRDGYLDIAIAGGAEATLTPGNLAGWNAMHVLATTDAAHPEQTCRPFSANRSGLVLGEGAGALVLESSDHAKRRGKTPLAEIAGYGIAGDATSVVKPDKAGQAVAMRLALADASMEPSAVGYLNAHGTGTPTGDIVETESIRETFGAASKQIAVSSTKALHGHLLGASGAVELIAAVMALRTGTIPPTSHLSVPDPQCDLDFVPNAARHGVRLRAVMSNSFAFGGTNAVLIARSASMA
jgi:3-oxoacyl-[acyl-carrier-protein] synthase II